MIDVIAFEEKYKDKGGIAKLSEMRATLWSQNDMAAHFGVSKTRLNQWLKQFFGENYDKRNERKEAIIASMFDFADNNSREHFELAFKDKTTYYKTVLFKLMSEQKYDTV